LEEGNYRYQLMLFLLAMLLVLLIMVSSCANKSLYNLPSNPLAPFGDGMEAGKLKSLKTFNIQNTCDICGKTCKSGCLNMKREICAHKGCLKSGLKSVKELEQLDDKTKHH